MDLDFKVQKGLDEKTVKLAKRLKSDFTKTFPVFMMHLPDGFISATLSKRMKYRVYKFNSDRNDSETYNFKNGFGYVSLDSKILKRDYYKAFQYFSHGVAHSFTCFNKFDLEFKTLMEEMNAEVVGYEALEFLLKGNDEKDLVIERVRKGSPSRYNKAYEIGERLEDRRPGFLRKLNSLLYQLERNSPTNILRKIPFLKFLDSEEKLVKRVENEFLEACGGLGIKKEELEDLEREFGNKKMYLMEDRFTPI
jgi:hypothetical protein